MNDDTHDDGLVHSHGWATEPPPSVGMMLRPAPEDGCGAAKAPAAAVPAPAADHDDGLVHSHGWASGHG